MTIEQMKAEYKAAEAALKKLTTQYFGPNADKDAPVDWNALQKAEMLEERTRGRYAAAVLRAARAAGTLS